MASLNEFIGEIIDSISKARNYADQGSAELAEQYFADPFVKNLPIPHYTVDDVEVRVPVMVVGIKTNSQRYEACIAQMIETTSTQLPPLLLKTLRYNYFQEKEIEAKANTPKQGSRSDDDDDDDDDMSEKQGKGSDKQKSLDVPKATQSFFVSVSNKIGEEIEGFLKRYLNGYNYQILKLLDLTESLSKEMVKQLTKLLRTYPKDAQPSDEEAYANRIAKYVGNIMFFEYKKILQTDSGIEIDANTAKMNEFTSQADCLMHITVKMREQDLNLLIEHQDGKEKRFLSLT